MGLPRSHSITSQAEFQRVFRLGTRRSGACLKVCAVRSNAGRTRYGMAVGRRVGGAVIRNRVKRVLREQLRELKLTEPWDVVIVARPESAGRSSRQIGAELRQLFARAGVDVV